MPRDPDAGLIRDETGTQRLIGYVTDVGQPDGRARVYLDVGPQHTNRHNVLHGGVIAAVLDNACGATGSLSVDSTGTVPFLSVSMTIQYLAPAASGGRVTATATITGGGRKLLFIDGELRDDAGTLIATSTGVYKRVPQEKLT